MRKILITLILFVLTTNTIYLQDLDDTELKLKAVEKLNIDLKSSTVGQKGTINDTGRVVIPSVTRPDSAYFVKEFSDRKTANKLKAFGYEIFSYTSTTFEPLLNVPIPKSYFIGPGDEIIITIWGETQLSNAVVVSKDGDIVVPEVGLVKVNGLSLKELKSKLFSLYSKKYSSLLSSDGNKASSFLDVSTGTLRTVKIFVLGEVAKPGGYTLPSLSSAFTALYFAGGPNLSGTLRDIKVIRRGKTVATIDVYDYLLKGDKSLDFRLDDEDVVFVPPVGKRVGVSGAVFRPAIYELLSKETFKDLYKYSGGLLFSSDPGRVYIERVVPFEQRKDFKYNLLSIDLLFKNLDDLNNDSTDIENGDIVHFQSIKKIPENLVTIKGLVKQPGDFEIEGTMTVKSLIEKAGGLMPNAFIPNAVLFRFVEENDRKEVYPLNLEKILSSDPKFNLTLQNRDEIQILRTGDFFPTRSYEIYGAVKKPGFYSRYEKLKLSTAIVLAGGLTDTATTLNIEISRLDTMNSGIFRETIIMNLPFDYWNTKLEDDFYLSDYDRIHIKADPNKDFGEKVFVGGEVTFPGAYSITFRGEKILSFIKRAGGFTSSAYKQGIYVQRKNELFDSYVKPDIPDSILIKYQGIVNQEILRKFSERIPIKWNEIEADSNSEFNITLLPGDSIVVNTNNNTILVIGEVNLPSSAIWTEGENLNHYIKQAGGFTENADADNVIVIQPNGAKWESSGFFLIPDDEIYAGATIIVPTIFEEPTDSWPIIRDIFSIASSVAVLILTVQNLSK